jgi:hypothetical protein
VKSSTAMDGNAEQHSFEYGLTQNGDAACAQRQTDRDFTTPVDDTYEQQASRVRTGNKKNYDDGEKESADKGTGFGDRHFIESSHGWTKMAIRQCGWKAAHDFTRRRKRVLFSLGRSPTGL